MNWVLFLLLAWIAVSAILAVVVGQVIHMRDTRESPPPLDGISEIWRAPGQDFTAGPTDPTGMATARRARPIEVDSSLTSREVGAPHRQ